MGDSGSMLIGLVFSASVVTLSGQFPPEALGSTRSSLLPTLLPLLLPVFILVVPLMDLLMAVLRRSWGLRSPFSPDKLHLHHRLLEIGHSHRRAVLIMWLWAALVSFGAVLISLYPGRAVVWAMIGATTVARPMGLTFLIPIIRKPRILALHEV